MPWHCLCFYRLFFRQELCKSRRESLTLHDKPYHFAGVNMWYAFYLGATPDGRARLVQELDTLRSLGITNIRISGGTEKSDLTHAFKRAMQLTREYTIRLCLKT